jgi:hypothetical protein
MHPPEKPVGELPLPLERKRLIMNIDQILSTPIDWVQTGVEKWILHTELDGRRINLRLNDYPEENLCTVFLEDQKYELDDLPKCWTLPAHRAKSS